MEITEVNKKIVQRFYELVEQENYAEAKNFVIRILFFIFKWIHRFMEQTVL